ILCYLSTLLVYFYCSGDRRHLHSFPTRRSSDLAWAGADTPTGRADTAEGPGDGQKHSPGQGDPCQQRLRRGTRGSCGRCGRDLRSEEHTSELQSRRDLVCRLLLEKKKQRQNTSA